MTAANNNSAMNTPFLERSGNANSPQTTLKLPMPTSMKLANHRTVLIHDEVFARLQALQKTPTYFTSKGVQHEVGASVDLRLIATALLNLALKDSALCNAAVADALVTLQRQLSQVSSTTKPATSTHQEQ